MPEIVGFLEIWAFLKKIDGFFEIPKVGKFAVECVSNGIIL